MSFHITNNYFDSLILYKYVLWEYFNVHNILIQSTRTKNLG